jgi:hypothetical protein
MKTLTAFLLGVLATAALAAAARAPSKYVDATYGFSIDAPAFAAVEKGASVSPAMFLAPPRDGFSTNVNVLIQENEIGIDAYAETTREQMKQVGLTLIEDKKVEVSGKPALRLEYAGKGQGGRPMHWTAVAVAARGRVYLVTATSLEADWPKQEKALRACLESFSLTE